MTAEQEILEPLNSATSRLSDWTMVGADAEGSDAREQKYDFFFYGTLLVPAILVRVLGHECADLTFQDAALHDFTRHQVKAADYPAVINRDQTATLVPKEKVLLDEDFLTRGTLVRGLSYADIGALDIFEGTQYSRVKTTVQVLSAPSGVHSLPKSLTDPSLRERFDGAQADQAAKNLQDDTQGQDVAAELPAWVYVWGEDLSGLEPDIWSFEQFLRDKAHLWTGMDTTEYDEVEQHRALATLPGAPQGNPAASPDEIGLDGEEAKILGRTKEGYPEFGHGMLKYWKFDKDLVNLNHGSYGSPPIPVIDAMRKLSDEIESFPDIFMRRNWLPKLNDVRSKVAGLIGARQDEVVIVPNATHGVNNIVTQMNWQDGDVVIMFNITYGAVAQTMKHLCDRQAGLSLEVVDLTFPCSHAEVLRKTEEVIHKYNVLATPSYTGEPKPTGQTPNSRVRMMILDSIASNPGVIYPWEALVKMCKKYGIISLVDAAHSIGQHKVDLAQVDPDFFVSNCHKWLMSHRGGALLYVPLRNQHLIRSTFPTSAGYESTRYPTEGVDRPWAWAKQYEWTGTLDWAPWLTIADAIKFREDIGGEERIMQYNHTLAVQGGRRLRKLWRTDIMENVKLEDGELTAAMVNVALPDVPEAKDIQERFKQQQYFMDQMFEAKTFAAVFWHGGRWWCRFSGQVWLELSDFDFIGDFFLKACEGVRRGEHLQAPVPATETLEQAEDLPVADA